jgi:hypothetical protein
MKTFSNNLFEITILKRYLNAARPMLKNGCKELQRDPIRKQPLRIENLSNLLTSSIIANLLSKKEELKLVKKIISLKINNSWLEFGYKNTDETVGYRGVVTTAMALISLILFYQYRAPNNKKLFNLIIQACDALMLHESCGYVKKADINRNDVFNTNLMAALVFYFISLQLKESSNRHTQYLDAMRRIIWHTIQYQSFKGFFPYQSNTPRVSILYHNMVCGQLNFFQNVINDDLLNLVLRKSGKMIDDLFDSKDINWEKQTLDDKTGAIWSYSWAYLSKEYLSADTVKKIQSNLLLKQNKSGWFCSDFDKRDDPFYSAWVVFALSLRIYLDSNIKKNGQNLIRTKFFCNAWIRFLLLRLVHIFLFFKATFYYLLKKINHKIFFDGNSISRFEGF